MAKHFFDWATQALVAIGGINWGVWGISNLAGKQFDLITSWAPMWLADILFVLVGLSGLYTIYYMFVSKK